MSKRLQVLLDEAELGAVREAAARQGMPVSEWVRRALRDARRREPRGDLHDKVRAIRAAAGYSFPTPDIDEILGASGDRAAPSSARSPAGPSCGGTASPRTSR